MNPTFPTLILPQLASHSSSGPPSGDEWIHEIKLDGYRLLCRKDGECVDLFTRNGHCWTDKFPAITDEVRRLPAQRLWLDGELVVMTGEGRSCFGSLQRAVADRDQGRLAFYAFDMLHCNDRCLWEEGVEFRKGALAELIGEGAWNLQYVDHIVGAGPEFFAAACGQELEGIISKRIGSAYRPGKRSQSWVKSKSKVYPRNVAWEWWKR